jgi:hypothetical protein
MAEKKAAKKAAKVRSPIKHFSKDEADKFVAKVQKAKGFKSAAETTVFLIGYAANRMAALERNAKKAA